MEEAVLGCTVWEDVQKETFERLAQFAYLGDYEAEMPRSMGKHDSEGEFGR
jgi:hypothetical protein